MGANMALKAKRIEPALQDAVTADDVHAPALDPHQVIECLELDARSDIDNAPRGIVFGTLLGALAWSVIALVLALLL
jgi:hypothetical protein